MGRPPRPLTFHPEILRPSQRRVLERLGRLGASRSFYLAGGTAVALHLGHRRSDDLDCMTGEPLQDPLDLAARLRSGGLPVEVLEVADGTLHASVSRVRVSFFEYRYALLRPPATWNAVGVSVAGVEDLAAMKLAAVAQRGSRKDFVDIYAIGRERIPLARMLALYRQKYSVRDAGHVLYGLSYFADADRERMPRMVWKVGWQEIKSSIRAWVRAQAGT